MVYKFDDHCMRNDWLCLIEGALGQSQQVHQVGAPHQDYRACIRAAQAESASLRERGLLIRSTEEEALTALVEIKAPSSTLFLELAQLLRC